MLPFIAAALVVSLAACSEEDKAEKDGTPKSETKQEGTKSEKATAEEMQAKLAKQQIDKSKIVAVVNDEELNGEKYNEVLTSIQVQMQKMGQDPSTKESAEQVKTQALDTLISQTLIFQKAKEANIKASKTEVDEQYSTFEEQFGGEKELKKALEIQNMDVKVLKEQIADSIIFDKYQDKVAPANKVSDKEIQDYYDQVAAQSKEAGQELPPLKEVSKEIQEILKQQQQQKLLATHVEELKANAEIELKI